MSESFDKPSSNPVFPTPPQYVETKPAVVVKPVKRAVQKRQVTVSKTVVTAILNKATEIRTLQPEVHDFALTLTGAENDSELVAAIFSNPVNHQKQLDDVTMILGADPIDAVVDVMEMGRDRMRSIWKLLTSMGVVTGGIGPSDPKAAAAIARAVQTIDDDTQKMLTAVEKVLRVN